MRIKSDFVTNSSSTGFVVCIPSDFFIEDQDRIISRFKDHDYSQDGWEPTRIISEFEACIDSLKSGDNVWSYGSEGWDGRIFYTVADICSDEGVMLAHYELGGEGNNMIIGIKEGRMKKWLMSNELKHLTIEES